MTDSHFMKDPSKVFLEFIGFDHRSHEFHRGYEAGLMGMALELITVAKTVEALPYEEDLIPSEIISTIYTLLNGMGLTEHATLWYERTADWRRVSFDPDASLPDAVSAGQLSLLPQPPRGGAGVSPLGAAARPRRRLATLGSDQSQAPASAPSASRPPASETTTRSGLSRSPGETSDEADETRVQHSPRRTGSV